MPNASSVVMLNTSTEDEVVCGPSQFVLYSLIDIITFLTGEPLTINLLWISFTSSETMDILNCNLAVIHSFQYLMSILHFIALFVLPHVGKPILKFLFVYAEIGGPTSLAFICMQRFVAVIYPTFYPRLKKYRYREVCAVTVWFLCVPVAFASIFAEDIVSRHSETAINTFPFVVMVYMSAMMVRCSISIARTLRKSGPGGGKLSPAKRRAFITVCATSAIALFFYIPVTFLQRVKFDEHAYVCIITPICILLLSAASVVHPLLYLSTKGKLFTCLKQEKNVR